MGEKYNNDPSSLDLYFRDVGKYALLNRAEEFRYGGAIQEGVTADELLRAEAQNEAIFPEGITEETLQQVVSAGRGAKETMIVCNLRLVISVARKYAGRGVELEDLIQNGNLGLIHAVDKFDHTKGFKFSTYSTWWIRQSITRAMAETGHHFRMPAHKHDSVMRYLRTRNELELKGIKKEEIEIQAYCAKKLGIELEEVQKLAMYALLLSPVSLDATVGSDDSDATLHSFIASNEPDPAAQTVDKADSLVVLRVIHDVLSSRDAEIAECLFVEEMSQADTAKEFGLSRERIRQIKYKAQRKITNELKKREIYG